MEKKGKTKMAKRRNELQVPKSGVVELAELEVAIVSGESGIAIDHNVLAKELHALQKADKKGHGVMDAVLAVGGLASNAAGIIGGNKTAKFERDAMAKNIAARKATYEKYRK